MGTNACLPEHDDVQSYLAAAVVIIDDLIALTGELAAERDAALARAEAAEREIKALRWCTGAQQRTIVRQSEEVRDLRRRLPRYLQGRLAPEEAFIAAHDIVDVVGKVTDLHRHENGHRRYLAGTCPFCAQPSLAVYAYHAQFACYCCGKAGTVWDYLRHLQQKGTAA